MSVGKMTGPKKAAILLLALGEDAAADVMKNLEEAEIQQVGYYMIRFTDVSPEELDLVLEEFYHNSVMAEDGVKNINITYEERDMVRAAQQAVLEESAHWVREHDPESGEVVDRLVIPIDDAMNIVAGNTE